MNKTKKMNFGAFRELLLVGVVLLLCCMDDYEFAVFICQQYFQYTAAGILYSNSSGWNDDGYYYR